MQLKQLTHFLAAVDHGTIGRAADSLHLTQPALTRSVRKLEQALNVRLLERGRQGVTPTPYGLVFAERARVIVNEAKQARGELDAMRFGRLGHVRLGIGDSAATEMLAEALSGLLATRPDLTVSLDTGFRDTHLSMLRRGELDAVLTLRPQLGISPAFTFEHLQDIEIPVVARAQHPLVRRGRRIRAAELARSLWIIYSQPGAEEYHRRLLQLETAGEPVLRLRCNTPALIKQLLLYGDYLALMAPPLIAEELASGRLVPVDTEVVPIRSELCVVTRTGTVQTTALRMTLETIRARMSRGGGETVAKTGLANKRTRPHHA